MTEQQSLDNLAFRVGISAGEAANLMRDIGFERCYKLLEEVAADTKHKKPALFRQKARRAKIEYSQNRTDNDQRESYRQMVEDYEAIKERIPRMTPQILYERLNKLYAQRKLHEYVGDMRGLPPGYKEMDYEQQEGVLLGLGMKGVRILMGKDGLREIGGKEDNESQGTAPVDVT